MTTLQPREPYTQEELRKLYPKNLKLQLVQVFLRHGERTPVSARFQNTGLPAYWPYCAVAQQMRSMVAIQDDLSEWDTMKWRRQIETFGNSDVAVPASGPGGDVGQICQMGELTDRGRQTTFALGQRLRHLYVDQLGFMPKVKSDADDMYIRATPIPRALESVQETFWGMYPANARTAGFLAPAIVSRVFADETLYPNEDACRRFRQLVRLFADRAASKWNDTEEMGYLNKIWSKWMPSASPRVAVDAHPRLSGIMDTVNATLGHGPATRLPPEFYDEKGRKLMERIAVEEWFDGYKENSEYRRLGSGGLMADVVDRMVDSAVGSGWRIPSLPARSTQPPPAIRFALSGCHDTTLAGMLSSLGAFENEKWPPYTSSVAVELFSVAGELQDQYNGGTSAGNVLEEISGSQVSPHGHKRDSRGDGGLFSFFNPFTSSPSLSSSKPPSLYTEIARTPLTEIPESTKQKLRKYYVRIRYNDQPVRIPGCVSKTSNHLPGDDSFCTLEAFKEIVDKFTPKNWKVECMENLGQGIFGKDDKDKSVAGY